jgi:hypothetical protein
LPHPRCDLTAAAGDVELGVQHFEPNAVQVDQGILDLADRRRFEAPVSLVPDAVDAQPARLQILDEPDHAGAPVGWNFPSAWMTVDGSCSVEPLAAMMCRESIRIWSRWIKRLGMFRQRAVGFDLSRPAASPTPNHGDPPGA